MLGLLRLPPLLIMAVILAIAGYIVYRMVGAGQAQPLSIIVLVLLAFLLVRVLFRMRFTKQSSENDD